MKDLISATLKSGNRVWFVGNVDLLPPGEAAPSLPPAPNSRWIVVPAAWSSFSGLRQPGSLFASRQPGEGP